MHKWYINIFFKFSIIVLIIVDKYKWGSCISCQMNRYIFIKKLPLLIFWNSIYEKLRNERSYFKSNKMWKYNQNKSKCFCLNRRIKHSSLVQIQENISGCGHYFFQIKMNQMNLLYVKWKLCLKKFKIAEKNWNKYT